MEEVKTLKKMFTSVLFAVLILSACNSSKLSFSEIENVPIKVQDAIDSNLRLQSINDEKGYYIIFHSSGEVEANLDTQGDTVIIKFDVSNSKGDAVKQNIYYLTTDSNHDTINVHLNGKSVPFDGVSIIN